MINQIDAAGIINREMPGYQIQKQVSYNNFFVFILSPPDEAEPDVFVKVSKTDGSYTDFSPWNEPDPLALQAALLAG